MAKKAPKLKWTVEAPPTGKWRSFDTRGWPSAVYKGTDLMAIRLESESEYVPRNVKTGEHKEISIYIADYSADSPEHGKWRWRKCLHKAKTLEEAKEYAQKVIEHHISFRPKELS